MNSDTELILDLWNHCNNRCRFCYNQTIFHLPENVEEHLDTCNDILNSGFVKGFNKLRILGGELFDGAIDILNVRDKFNKILISISNLLKNDVDKLNLLTNLIYADNKDLKETLQFFENQGLIHKVEISTSYDMYGRFSEESETWWWNNINWIKTNYPFMKIDIGMIMTQPFITNVTKEWLDEFIEKTGENCRINFNELDTAVNGFVKKESPYKDLFPKRKDFIAFIKNLKQWNHQDLIGIEPGGIDPWSRTLSVQYLFSHKLPFPLFKNLNLLLTERDTFREDGYIDSDIPLYSDVKKLLNAQ